MNKRIERKSLPIKDNWFNLCLSGEILYIAIRHDDLLELWVVQDDDREGVPRKFRLFGAGQLLPSDCELRYIASTQANDFVVWHLFERI